MTRSPAQKPACKDHSRNGQERAIAAEAAYTPVSNRAGSRSLSITRSPAQESACKDLGRNDQVRVITSKAAYTPTPKRAGSRSLI
ncbi:ATP-dependent nuclease subunit B [Lacticaseibacillus rhamnosus]|nr:ATP-dependent nuclease subunit B [Lacticaseibacillus rhamnosus]